MYPRRTRAAPKRRRTYSVKRRTPLKRKRVAYKPSAFRRYGKLALGAAAAGGLGYLGYRMGYGKLARNAAVYAKRKVQGAYDSYNYGRADDEGDMEMSPMLRFPGNKPYVALQSSNIYPNLNPEPYYNPLVSDFSEAKRPALSWDNLVAAGHKIKQYAQNPYAAAMNDAYS